MPEELGDPLSELGILTARDHGPAPDQDGCPAERDRLLGRSGGARTTTSRTGSIAATPTCAGSTSIATAS
jgi:hypothetical protein